MKPAHPILRITAAIADWIIPIPLVLLLIRYAAEASSLEMLLSRLLLVIIFWTLLGLVFGLLQAYLTGKTGSSVGKWLWGTTVTDPEGKPISMKRAFFRTYAGPMISSPLFGMGYSWILKDPLRRGWHDLASGTVVHRTQPNRWIFGLATIIAMTVINIQILGKIGYELHVHGYLYRDMMMDIQKEMRKNDTEKYNADREMIVPLKEAPEI